MCGRFVAAGTTSDLVALFDVDLPADELPGPSWNVAPTTRVSIVLDSIPKDADDDVPVRRLESARWGLVPSWAKELTSGPTAFNARIESVTEKRTFSGAVAKRRAVIPATGYYEWRTTDGIKTPFFIHLPDDRLLAFAGLYEWWRDPLATDDDPNRWVLSTTIMTRQATGTLAEIHDRMPVFLQPELLDEWLDPHEQDAHHLLEAVSVGAEELADEAEFYEVGSAVGNVRNNSAQLSEPVTAGAEPG